MSGRGWHSLIVVRVGLLLVDLWKVLWWIVMQVFEDVGNACVEAFIALCDVLPKLFVEVEV